MNDELLVVILAAGCSSRLGQAKQLLVIDDETLIHRQCRVAVVAEIGRVVVVVGCEAEKCAAAVADLDVAVIGNSRWQEGLASSVRCAVREAMERKAAGLMILHVDQYRISPGDLRGLCDAWRTSGCTSTIRSRAGEYLGPPVILPSDLFEKCLKLRGERGAGVMLSNLPAELCTEVHVPSAAFDIDVREDIPERQVLRRNSAAGAL